MTGHSTRIVVSMALVAGLTSAARGTSRDYINETLVSQEFKAREFGLEVAAESRLDRDYRLQGWYTGELEASATRRWFAEATLSGLDRGQGLELAAWRFGTRYRVVTRSVGPLDVTAAVEYEVQAPAAKHPFYERELVPRLVLTREIAGRWTATGNLGTVSRLAPVRATKFAWGAGARWPEGGPLMAGAEIAREPIERVTRITPQLWIALPGEARLRLGGSFSTVAHPYWFVARAIAEAEF